MKLHCSIFDKMVVVDENSHFSQDFESPTSGTLFSATTLAGETVLTISPKELNPQGGKATPVELEHVIRLPIRDKLWNIETDPLSDITLIAIGGEEPEVDISGQKSQISVGGEWPEMPTKIKLK